MSLKTVRNYIDGQWITPENNGYLDIVNPSTGQIIGKTPLSTPAETDRAINVAAEAFKTWGQPLYPVVSSLYINWTHYCATMKKKSPELLSRRWESHSRMHGLR